ncbi:MAG: hypothetical protein ABIJ09_23420 [Pseudomonadota bacterium]
MHSDEIYALRPTAVQRHFGVGSRALVLSGTALVEAAAAAQVGTVAVEVDRFEVLPGVLRACEDLDAALTVIAGSFWDGEGSRQAALTTSSAVVRGADAVHFGAPLVLATVVDAALGGMPVDLAGEILHDVIDAGFTSFLFPIPQAQDELHRTLALMQVVAEFGLGIELVDLPAGSADRVLDLFARCGLAPSTLTEAGASHASLVVDGVMVSPELAHRRLLSGETFLRIIARSLEVDDDEALFAPIDAITRDRIEGVTYAEVRLALRKHGLLGSGSSCLASLTWME